MLLYLASTYLQFLFYISRLSDCSRFYIECDLNILFQAVWEIFSFTSFAAMGANLGILLATSVSAICSYFLSNEIFQTVGWRIPYLLSGVLSLFIFYTRLQMQETPIFSQLKKQHLLSVNPISTVLRTNIPYVLRTIGMMIIFVPLAGLLCFSVSMANR